MHIKNLFVNLFLLIRYFGFLPPIRGLGRERVFCRSNIYPPGPLKQNIVKSVLASIQSAGILMKGGDAYGSIQ